MPRYVALLRAVNVAGKGMVSMSALRDLFTDLGFEDVKTLLQSGNVIFSAGRRSDAALEKLLEGETAKRLSISTDYMVRTAAEWHEIVSQNPYPKEAKSDPSHLVLMPLKDAPKAADVKALQAAIIGRETVRAEGRQLYITYPDGIGRSKLTNALIEKKLGTRGTGRNWNTVLKIGALLERE
jgi:uncharacterized protein (DUF1697 family)